ncbi:MAG: tryptophan-rich sensory protein [Anaerolineae bacterium]|nr:tryptophan-rich sensory protein [Anaerolineae bacterium]
MKNFNRQISVILTTILTITINGLANALPLNGLTTGEISDSFETYFVPAGYVFSIWGLIYIGLIAFAIYQALPAQRENQRLARIGWWVVVGNLANAAWIFFWHYQIFALTVVAMVTLLVSLLFTYKGLRSDEDNIQPAERWFAQVPFSIYLGWISVATIANISDVLYFFNWGQFGISAEVWMVIILLVVAILAWAMSLRQKDVAYLAVLLWALAGIGAKFPESGFITTAIWSAFGLVVLAFFFAAIPQKISS